MSDTDKQTYIAILRGINLGSKNAIKMPELVKTFEDRGFSDVRSYIQSGNIIFKSKTERPDALQQRIHLAIAEDFDLDIPVLVLGATDLKRVRDENPFSAREGIDPAKLHVTFLESEPSKEKVNAIDVTKYLPDEFIVMGAVLYLHCPIAYGTTKLSNGFFESKFKMKATTRNWNTVNKLVEMGSGTV